MIVAFMLALAAVQDTANVARLDLRQVYQAAAATGLLGRTALRHRAGRENCWGPAHAHAALTGERVRYREECSSGCACDGRRAALPHSGPEHGLGGRGSSSAICHRSALDSRCRPNLMPRPDAFALAE